MLDDFLSHIRGIIPTGVFNGLNPWYHRGIAFAAAVAYGFPSRRIKVIGITGTKGKSSTVELVNAMLEKAGHKTALTNTIRFKIAGDSRANLYKMSMPGRFFLQRFLRDAVRAGCDYAVLEMTSQGSISFRHRHIQLDAFVLTNISPEHIEAHGSYENYVRAKIAILRDGLVKSHKPDRTVIVNGDDKESAHFLEVVGQGDFRKVTYGIRDGEPYTAGANGIDFTWHGAKIHSPLSGQFNLYNILAAATAARSQGVDDGTIAAAVTEFSGISGRVEKVTVGQKQTFDVIVDYAHTIDSLEKLYRTFRADPDAPRTRRIIAILGGTGGGRDAGKRPGMGTLADRYADEVILTNEDPYDEDPDKIIANVAAGVISKEPLIIMDRREAIRTAISHAKSGDTILITGKGTDPYIMGPKGTKIPWSDARVVREEIETFLNK